MSIKYDYILGKLRLNDSASGGYNWTTDNQTVIDQVLEVSSLNQRFIYTNLTEANRTITLPSVAASEDGAWIEISNSSKYYIYINSSDTDYIGWSQLKVQSIELLPTSSITLRYDDIRQWWDVVKVTPSLHGRIQVKGLTLYLPFDELYTGTAGYLTTTDNTNRNHFSVASNPGMGLVSGASNVKFGSRCIEFSSNRFLSEGGSSAGGIQIFQANTTESTISYWVRHTNAATGLEVHLAQREDANNTWYLGRKSDGTFNLVYIQNGNTDIDISGGSIAQTTWTHVALCKVESNIGLYINGTQVAFTNSFTPDTLAGLMYIAQSGASASYYAGRMDDLFIAQTNIFGANPNSGNTDILNIDTVNPAGLIY